MGNSNSSASKSRPPSSVGQHVAPALTKIPNPPVQNNKVTLPKAKVMEDKNKPCLPWERDLKGFLFLKRHAIWKYSDVGLNVDEACSLVISTNSVIATTALNTIILDTSRRTIRELPHETSLDYRATVHSLSPDGKILVRWKWEMRDSESCVAEAIRTDTNTSFIQHRLQRKFSKNFNILWASSCSLYIPDCDQGTISSWSLEAPNTLECLLRPLSSIGRQQDIRIHLSKDKRWMVINGRTFKDRGTTATGLIQIHDNEKNEDRLIPGASCCIGEVEVYDQLKTLLLISDSANGMLSLKVQQIDENAPGQPFEPVEVSVNLLVREDCPSELIILEGLPIVVIMTTQQCLYFFELHSGSYLFSQTLDSGKWRLFGNTDDPHNIILYHFKKKEIHRVSVNTDDLIGYIRQVLHNDTLASSVAIRTGLPGADDIMFNDMHAEY